MSTESAIRADSLSKMYRSGGTEVIVFNKLSLQVRRGERLAIVGESGAGKSTLLHLLGGLERPTAGQIFYGNRDIVSLGEQALADFRNRAIGFVWQNPSLLPEFTALENIMMPLLIRGVVPDAARTTARVHLDEVGLEHRASHRAGELSGGEQQRVSLARALAGSPEVLLADEPTGSLDFRTGEMIIGLLNEIHLAHGLTSIFVTHNLSFASRCDRVLELKKGVLQTASLMEWQERTGQSPVVRADEVVERTGQSSVVRVNNVERTARSSVVRVNNVERTGRSSVVRVNNVERTGRLVPVVRVDEVVERTGRLVPAVRADEVVERTGQSPAVRADEVVERTGRLVPVVRVDEVVKRTGRSVPVVRVNKDATRLYGGTYV